MTLPRVLLLAALSWSLALALPPALDITRLQPEDPACRADLDLLRQGLDTGQPWAQTMWDAGVKSPVGLLSQTAVQFGDFDECLTISSPLAAQFCLVDVVPAQSTKAKVLPSKWGVCVPASCSAGLLQAAVQEYMDNRTARPGVFRVSVMPETCTTKKNVASEFTTGDIIFCALLTLAVLVVGVSTYCDLSTCPDADRLSGPRTLTQCLSARQGWYSLMRIDQPVAGVDLRSLYSLHALTIFFVILGHRFGFHLLFSSLTNYRSVENLFSDSWFSYWADHMDLFVDIFFFLSSFLLALLYYAELQKRFVSPLMVYFARLCRIVPAYVVVLFFVATVLRHLGDGPLWNLFMGVEQGMCQDYWWTNLLFINNYVEKDKLCLLHTWYLACDSQLFVVGVLLVFLLHQCPRLGTVVTGLVFLASTLSAFLGVYLYNRPGMLLFYKDFWNDPRHHDMFSSVYSQAHYRGTSYLPGLLAGCYVYSRRNDHLTKGRTWLFQLLGLLTCLVVYWSGALFYRVDPPRGLMAALYAASHHTVFAAGLALLVISFCIGKRTCLSRVFYWGGFVPLGKLSYCAYLAHCVPLFLWVASSRTTVYLNPVQLVTGTLGDVAFSLVLALFLYLVVEAPARYLVKHLMVELTPKITPD